jgi:hypothetical protein
MNSYDLHNLDDARRYLLQGLWLTRTSRPDPDRVKAPLDWLLQLANDGQPLLPIGVVADFGHLAFRGDHAVSAKDLPHVPNWPPTLSRSYEDHVLGKLYTDWTFERAVDALRRYTGADRPRGLAYTLKQFRERAKLGGVELSPAVIRGLTTANPKDLLAQGFESLTHDGPMPVLVQQYEDLVSTMRRMTEVLGAEDVAALEQRTALADMSLYVAHRQIVQLTTAIEARLPQRPVRPHLGRKEVPTRIHDEDQYPVGGYTSISNRGSIESLLHSQLAFMESDPAESPDMFDIKFARDELFFYSRDENQFLRRRRTFVMVFAADLVAARLKDAELPYQRIVLACATVLAMIHKLSDWLSNDAIRFELLFVQADDKVPLDDEFELFQILLRELREIGVVTIEAVASLTEATQRCILASRQSQVHVLEISVKSPRSEPDGVVMTSLTINAASPQLLDGFAAPVPIDSTDAMDHWSRTVLTILELWV